MLFASRVDYANLWISTSPMWVEGKSPGHSVFEVKPLIFVLANDSAILGIVVVCSLIPTLISAIKLRKPKGY